MKGITESHMQMIVWIIIVLMIVLLIVWFAMNYLHIFPFKVTFE